MITIEKLRDVCDQIIKDGKGNFAVMISVEMGWCPEHNHPMRCFCDIAGIEADLKRSLILFNTVQLADMVEAMAEEHEQH